LDLGKPSRAFSTWKCASWSESNKSIHIHVLDRAIVHHKALPVQNVLRTTQLAYYTAVMSAMSDASS